MKLVIRSRGIELSPPLHDLVVRRVRFALSRLDGAIRDVHVTLADVNGPRGGVDKVCRLRIRGPRIGALVVEDRDDVLERAVDRSVDRAARAVVRALERERALSV